jgi:hypothetical protein
MEFGNLDVGRRTFLASLASFFAGLYLFFEVSSLENMLLYTGILVLIFGSLAFFTENTSIGKSIFLWFVVLALVFLFAFVNLQSFCSSSASPYYAIAEHPLNGEVVEEKFIGSGDCSPDGFAWYYQQVPESEVQNYCQNNNGSAYCNKCVNDNYFLCLNAGEHSFNTSG